MSGNLDSPPPPYDTTNNGTTNKAFESGPGDKVVIVDFPSKSGQEKKPEAPGLEHSGHGGKGIKEQEDEEDDPWKISTVYIKVVPWSELSTAGRIKRVFWDYLGKILFLFGFLYLFICSLDFLSNAFRLLGGRAAGSIFSENELLSNPVVGLMIGILATVLFQSSSTTTSVVVSMVAANIIPVQNAIPLVMGANIGTSVTNTIVSIGQITNKNDFRRAFAGATVHDMFNWLTVLVLLPLEAASGYLYRLSDAIVKSFDLEKNEDADKDFLKTITHPFTNLIIQVDKKVIEKLAKNEATEKDSLLKICCDKPKKAEEDTTKQNISELFNVTSTETATVECPGNCSLDISANLTTTETVPVECLEKCKYMFAGVAESWGESTIGIVLLVLSLFILCACLVGIVKTLNSLLKGRVSIIIKKFVNADFPGRFSYFTGYLAILIGTGLTILVQSSSVFTSTLTPLVGIGVVALERMYPLTLGANIGTTTTAILAALAQSKDAIPNSLQIALCHLFFNISGIILFFPIPYLRFPIPMAKFLGNQTAKYRWFSILYLVVVFFIFPAAVFGLSLISWIAMAAVFGPILLIVIIVALIKVLQKKVPRVLPSVLRDWYFLPEFMRSLKPYDRAIQRLIIFCPCCKSKEEEEEHEEITVNVEKSESVPNTRL